MTFLALGAVGVCFLASTYGAFIKWRVLSLDPVAPRASCAVLAAAVIGSFFAPKKHSHAKAPPPEPASPADLERARQIIQKSPSTYGNLALRGDKTLLFSQSGHAFLMYSRQGHSWIAMGDPIGPEEDARDLLRIFCKLCDQFGGRPVVFEARERLSPVYHELGLVMTPLGEEARIDLKAFSLASAAHKSLRHSCSKLRRLGCSFEIVSPGAVPEMLPELACISDAWLAGKTTREKRFSNASFDGGYLRQFPLALVRRGRKTLAFANLWCGAGKEELSVDLMRHLPEAPNGTMDFLFAELLLWGKQAGYDWFNFGMAPLAGLDAHGGSLWQRVATFVYSHGEHFYNFQGLRRYKAKFNPVWVPLYLASPGGLSLPAILIEVTALMAGGIRGIVTK